MAPVVPSRRFPWRPRAILAPAAVVLALLAAAPAGAACLPSARPQPALDLSATAERRQGRPLSILAIGSSSTAGVGASRTEMSYPSQLAQRLAEALGTEAAVVFNAGVSGETAPATLKRLEALLKREPKPDLVIWQVGTNDGLFGGTAQALGQTVAHGLDAIRAADAAAIVIDQQFYPALRDPARFEPYVAAVDDVATTRSVPLLPRYALLRQWADDDPKGFAGLFAWDRFHMNDAGYACLAELLAASVIDAVSPPPAARIAGEARPAPQRGAATGQSR